MKFILLTSLLAITAVVSNPLGKPDLTSAMTRPRFGITSIMETIHRSITPTLTSQTKLNDRIDEDLIKVLMDTFNRIQDDRIYYAFLIMSFEDEKVNNFLRDTYEILEKIATKVANDETIDEDLIKALVETHNKIKDEEIFSAFVNMYFDSNDESIENFLMDMYEVLKEIAKKYKKKTRLE